jgi:osomolarity two-component system response regulator SKN7
LKVFGCATDVVVDGQAAVDKMIFEHYDLVLMVSAYFFKFILLRCLMVLFQDIKMPGLDGITATSLIRQFDPSTPIISMTADSKPGEIRVYYKSGESLKSTWTKKLIYFFFY